MASSNSQQSQSFAQVMQMMTAQAESARPIDETRPELETRPPESEQQVPPMPTAPVPQSQQPVSSLSSISQVPNPPLIDIGETGNVAFRQSSATYGAAGPEGPSKDDAEACKADEDFQKEVENNPEVKRVIEQIIAKIPKDACGVHPPQHRKEVVKVDSKCPPRTANIRRRLPSPEPDTVERVTVIKAVQDIINIVIEKPSMPPPCCVERTENEQPLRPLIRHNVVCVPASGKCPPGTKRYEPLAESQYQKEIAGYQCSQPETAAFTTPQAYRSAQFKSEQPEIEIPIMIEQPRSRPVKYATEPLSRVDRYLYNWPETLESESKISTTSYVRR